MSFSNDTYQEPEWPRATPVSFQTFKPLPTLQPIEPIVDLTSQSTPDLIEVDVHQPDQH